MDAEQNEIEALKEALDKLFLSRLYLCTSAGIITGSAVGLLSNNWLTGILAYGFIFFAAWGMTGLWLRRKFRNV